MPKSASELAGFRRRCQLFSHAVGLLLVLMILLLGLQFVTLVLGLHDGGGRPVVAQNREIVFSLVNLLPALCYLWALYSVYRAFARLARGEMFQATVASALRQIGYVVVAGALLRVFAVTNLTRMIVHGHGGFAYFDPSGITLGVVGVALILMAQLIDRARILQHELDAII